VSISEDQPARNRTELSREGLRAEVILPKWVAKISVPSTISTKGVKRDISNYVSLQ
jgi:hypothetical protein